MLGSSSNSSSMVIAQGSDGQSAGKRASRFVKGTVTPKPPNTDGAGIFAMLMHPLSILLIFFPMGMMSYILDWGEVTTFWLNFLALVPLAKILGDATEELAAGLKNDMLAGLLNATFGNAVEMVITIQTLRAGKLDIVKATLLGSVLSNLLLVLGCSFFCGGLVSQPKRNTQQSINEGEMIPMVISSSLVSAPRSGPGSRVSMFMVGGAGGAVGGGQGTNIHTGVGRRSQAARLSQVSGANSQVDPANLAPGREDSDPVRERSTVEFAGEVVQTFSAMSALVNVSMLLLSCLSFSLVTVFFSQSLKRNESGEMVSSLEDVLIPVSRTCSVIIIMAYVAYIFFQLVTHREAMSEEDDGGDDNEEPTISIGASIVIMFVITVIVAFSSELLVRSLDGVVEKAHIASHFIGIVLLPIVGNACEHASAIRFAIQGKPGLSIGIAVGSSTQISLFVVPFSVLTGWAMNQPMDLNFGVLNTTVMCIAVVVVLSVVVDGHANWLQGYLLMSAYSIICVLYWHLPDDVHGLPQNPA